MTTRNETRTVRKDVRVLWGMWFVGALLVAARELQLLSKLLGGN